MYLPTHTHTHTAHVPQHVSVCDTHAHVYIQTYSLVRRRGELSLVGAFFQTHSPREVRVLGLASGVHPREGVWVVKIRALLVDTGTTDVTVEVVT